MSEWSKRNRRDIDRRYRELLQDTQRREQEHREVVRVLEQEVARREQEYRETVQILEQEASRREQEQKERIQTLEQTVNELEYHINGKDIYDSMDYLSFENRFRGSREHIKGVQRPYVSYFVGKQNVVELGSGRGEFLELLQENGISVTGVDISEKLVRMCREQGLNAVCGDALSYLRSVTRVGGVFASQVIEHLPFADVIELCKLCYEKLEDGAYMILETPNPMSLSVFTHSFYMDPSHVKPVHPYTLKFLAEMAGFQETELLFTESSKFPVDIPALETGGTEMLEAFNRSMKCVEETLFGSQDYALIARK